MADFDYNTYNATSWASQEYVTASLSPLVIGWTIDISGFTYLVKAEDQVLIIAYNLALWGVAASQFFVYTGSAHFQTDSRRVRWTVFAVTLFATINSA